VTGTGKKSLGRRRQSNCTKLPRGAGRGDPPSPGQTDSSVFPHALTPSLALPHIHTCKACTKRELRRRRDKKPVPQKLSPILRVDGVRGTGKQTSLQFSLFSGLEVNPAMIVTQGLNHGGHPPPPRERSGINWQFLDCFCMKVSS